MVYGLSAGLELLCIECALGNGAGDCGFDERDAVGLRWVGNMEKYETLIRSGCHSLPWIMKQHLQHPKATPCTSHQLNYTNLSQRLVNLSPSRQRRTKVRSPIFIPRQHLCIHNTLAAAVAVRIRRRVEDVPRLFAVRAREEATPWHVSNQMHNLASTPVSHTYYDPVHSSARLC